MKETLVCLFFFSFVCFQTIYGQVDTFLNAKPIPKKSVLVPQKDTIPTATSDLSKTDSEVKISENGLDAKVEIGAKDTMIFNNSENKMHLYGDAFVKYQGMELKAGYIVVDLDSNIAVAQTHFDSVGQVAGKPVFTDGSQNFEANKMRYNFKSQKGLVFGVTTTQSNLFLTGTRTKIVSRDVTKRDTSFTENILYNRKAIFSTCDLPHPHYGVRSSKQKVIADKVVVAGPSNLEIGGIPIPVVLPFAVFPLKQIQSTGLIFPQGYEYSPELGYGLDRVGWYFPINDYVDLSLTGQIYWHGTWGLNADSRYRKRYKYNGTLALSYASRRTIDNDGRTNTYAIRWNHNQDAKAHPTRRLTGSVNIQGNGFQQVNNNDARSQLQNSLSSNVSYTQTFPDKPFRFSASMRHSQNTRTNKVEVNFPTLNFQMKEVYPFRKKGGSSGSKEKWYEKLAFRYNAEAKNTFTATDTTLFSQQTIDDARFGFKHDVSTNLNFNLLKYINVSPNASLKETWNFKTLNRTFQEQIETEFDSIENTIDTLSFGEIIDSTVFGVEPFRELSTGVSFNTILYGTMQFKKGRLKGIRHTVKPSIGFTYIPASVNDYENRNNFFRNGLDRYGVNTGADTLSLETYNIFQGGIYGSPRTGQEQKILNYSLNNIFEAKYFSRKDSIDKKLKIFDNIRVSGNYNFAAETFKASAITVGGTTRLFEGMTTLNINARWDPYAVNANNVRIETSYLKSTGWKKPLRFLRSDFRLNTRISVSALKKLFKKDKPNSVASRSTASRSSSEGGSRRGGPQSQNSQPEPEDGFLKFLEGFNVSHSLVFNAIKDSNQETQWGIQTHSINMTVRQIQLTENWGIGVGNIGYDFKRKSLTYPDIRITRNLHCWEAFFSWQPQRGTYFFTIKVKNAPLDALKIPYSKNNVDAFGGF